MKKNNPFSRKLGLAVIGAALLVGFGFVIVRSGPLAPTQVTIIRAEIGSLPSSLFGIGTVEARRSYFIGPTAAGRIKAVYIDVGDSVKTGQLLAEIDPVDLDERIRSLEASFARAKSAVSSAEALRKDVLARKEVAGLNAKRYLDLGEKRFVSSSAVESKQQELISAQATVESAEANLQGARQEVARLKADQKGLRQQRQNLRLVAPHSGIVTSRDAEPGSTVIAGQSVVKVVEPDSLWVKVRLDQGRSRGLAVGQAAEIALRSNPVAPLPGKVARIEPVSDSVTEERITLVVFDRIPSELSIGELAEVTVKTTPNSSALMLPNAAIKHTSQGTGVWKLQDGKPSYVAVKIGNMSLDGQVQVHNGIQSGDEIIVHSEKELSEGGRIKVVDQLVGHRK
jgi:HlyD family secretion protein